MSIYVVQGTKTTTAQTALVIVSTAAIRPRIIHYKLGTTGAPTSDASVDIQIKRITTTGTTTAVTPAPKDPNDPAATVIAGSNASAEPTYTANTTVDEVGYNPRATAQWTAYDKDAEIILPATANAGAGFFVNLLGGASTVLVNAEVRQ